MTNKWLIRKMGIDEIEIEAQSISLRYLLVDSLRTLSNAFVQIFILLYIIDVLGFYQAGILVPPPSQFELLPFIGEILVFNTFGGLFIALFIVILGKYELDYFPDNLVNSLLSFRASLATAFAFPLQIFAGWIVVEYSFSTGILVLALISIVGISILSISFRHPLVEYHGQYERIQN